MSDRPKFTLTIEAEPTRPGEPDAIQRLRRFLKTAQRSYGLRCLGVVEEKPKPLPPAPIELDPTKSEPPFA